MQSSAAAAPASSLCPICEVCVWHSAPGAFEAHVKGCCEKDNGAARPAAAAAASSSAASAAAPLPLAAEISRLQSLLRSQSPHSLSELAPQLQMLESQIHAALVPIATRGGIVGVVPSDDSASSDVVATKPTRHVLTARGSISRNPLLVDEDAAALRPVSPASQARASAIALSFSPKPADSRSPYAASSSQLPAYIDLDAPVPAATAAAASSSSASHVHAASSSSSSSTGLSDEELIAQMMAEEEAMAAADKRARAAAAEAEFALFLQKEGSCSKCGSAAADQLMPMCEDAASRRAKGQPACEHKICHSCLRVYLQAVMRKMSSPAAAANASPTPLVTEGDLHCPCPGCSTSLSQWQMKRVLSAAEFESLLAGTFKNMIAKSSAASANTNTPGRARYVRCPNAACGSVFEAVDGSGDVQRSAVAGAAELGLDGQPMSEAAKQHRAKMRFRCNQCATIFCGQCSANPYHDGFNCEQWAAYQNQRKCRFCQSGLTASNTARPASSTESIFKQHASAIMGGVVGSIVGLFGSSSSAMAAAPGGAAAAASSASASAASAVSSPSALTDVCNSAECVEKRNTSCDKTLPCGHACGGVAGERSCLVCLHEDCPAHVASGCDMNEEDFCNICYVEGLGAAPTLQLACGHLFHQKCLQDKLSRRWPSARVHFGFLNCPLCKREMEHPALASSMAPMLRMKAEVTAKATHRLTFEGMDNEPAFKLPSGRYYQRKSEYAMDRFAYYICFKCKQPYFGGQRRCEEAAQAAAAAQRGGGEEKFDPSELVCGGCISGPDAKSCSKHGKEFTEFKCKFCCSVASFYCWGSTHFCSDCHRRQESGDYVTRKPVEQLPKCLGAGKCPLGMKHPPNGTEFALGCGVCRPRDF